MHGTSGHCLINFSTFASNIATDSVCLEQGLQYDGDYLDCFCNIVNNSQKSTNNGCISINSNTIIENCTILGPYGNGKVFKIDEFGMLSIKNCKIDNFTIDGTNTSTIDYVTGSDLNPLSHFSSNDCEAKINIIKSPRKQIKEEDKTLVKEYSIFEYAEYIFFAFALFEPS